MLRSSMPAKLALVKGGRRGHDIISFGVHPFQRPTASLDEAVGYWSFPAFTRPFLLSGDVPRDVEEDAER